MHDYFEHDGTPYIAMEYIERGSLRPYVGGMNLAQIGGVLEGLLAGLAHGEQHGIVHRDLKPENLMVTSDGRVKIADFGIAKATNNMQTGAFLTATGTTVGTPTYMAPEQAMAQDIGPPTDLYSVGCMAFEMFTGRVPFHDTEAPMAILLRHVNEPIPRVKSIDPTIDQDISDWIDRMLVKDPKQRTQSASDAWDEFEEIVIGLLGPRWRREARLREGSAQLDTPAPLTPAPFQGTTADAAVSDEFQSFAWGNAVTPDAPPGPATPPPSQSLPVPPDPVVGPPTPAPGPAVSSDGTAPPDQIDSGFVTFGAPAAEPEAPEVETGDPLEASAPAEVEPPTVEQPEPVEETPAEDEAFETYIAPAPLRPPTDDEETPTVVPEPPAAAPEPPPAPEPEPIPEPVAEAPPAPAPTPPAPAPVPVQDDLAATVMPASITPPPPVEEKPAQPTVPVERERKPEPVDEEPRERKSGRGALIGFGIAAVVAAVLGFVIGGSGGSDKAPSSGGKPTAAVSNADLAAKVPSNWKKASAAQIPGMSFTSPIAQSPGGSESIVIGQVKDSSAANATLLPAGFLKALGLSGGEAPPRQAVRLADNKLEAYRYANLRPSGISKPVTLFTVPTSAGIATVACVDPSADCESIANTLKLNAGTAFPVGPSKAYAAELSKTLGTLDKKVKAGTKALSSASTPKAQAAAAKGLSSAYNSASSSLSSAKVSPADAAANAQLAAALKATGAAYSKLAAAASSGNKAAYNKAQTQVQTAEAAVTRALNGIKAAGYQISGG